MAFTRTLALCLLLSIPAALLSPVPPSDNYIYFPDEEGNPHLVHLDDNEASDSEFFRLHERLDSIQFILYTRNNLPSGEILKPDLENLKKSDWDPKRPTRIVTHGWRGSAQVKSCTLIRDAYLEVDDYNVIVVDWSEIAASIDYVAVVRAVEDVGKTVAKFIEFLKEEAELDETVLKIIGHSLGAHVAGIAARNSGGTAAGVVGLDPAGPLFRFKSPGNRIDASDAKHVQIIHTNAGALGHSGIIGTSDFFPNGGSVQPGCGLDLFSKCSHSRSYYYYAESILNPLGFPAWSGDETPKLATSNQAFMGGPVLDSNAKGSYTLETNENPPFAQG